MTFVKPSRRFVVSSNLGTAARYLEPNGENMNKHHQMGTSGALLQTCDHWPPRAYTRHVSDV